MKLVLGRDLPKRAVRRLVREGRKPVRRMIPRCRALDMIAANSLCDTARVDGLQRLAESVVDRGLAGEMVEYAVYRGGSAVVIAERLLRGWLTRQVWLVDVFEGMPEPGGAVVFDDYGHWSGCRKAVDEFIAERAIGVHLTPIDSTSHYFLKPHVG